MATSQVWPKTCRIFWRTSLQRDKETEARDQLWEKPIGSRDSHFEGLSSCLIWTDDEIDKEAFGRARLTEGSLYESRKLKAQRKPVEMLDARGVSLWIEEDMERPCWQKERSQWP